MAQTAAIRDHDPRNPPQWLEPTLESLLDLRKLPPGWNSYAAPPIDAQAIVNALDLLTHTMQAATPAPWVGPTARGGVRLEWHERGIDLEVSVAPDGRVTAAYEDAAGEWEADLTSDRGRLAKSLARLTAPT